MSKSVFKELSDLQKELDDVGKEIEKLCSRQYNHVKKMSALTGSVKMCIPVTDEKLEIHINMCKDTFKLFCVIKSKNGVDFSGHVYDWDGRSLLMLGLVKALIEEFNKKYISDLPEINDIYLMEKSIYQSILMQIDNLK